jgi:hypothetical protein
VASLSEERAKFSVMVSEFVIWANQQPGVRLVYDQVKRSAVDQSHYVEEGSAKTQNSAHLNGLAADLLLYLNEVYQRKTEAYQFLGEEWERRGGKWGGRWGWDGNHFQLKD